ncbi:MAG TPA: hypothetical protein PK252_09005 [Bacteroidales bacterium]|nr:hypothetical protein [Bacteroidales bacterium]
MNPQLSIVTSDPKMFVLVVFSLSFVLSMVAAFVLFKFLQSTAVINNKNYQAGGALAGFIIVLGASYMMINNLLKTTSTIDQPQPQVVENTWTLVGNVKLVGKNVNDGIKVSIQPPSPTTSTDFNGDFRMDNISTSHGFSKKSNPAIKLEYPGYLPRTVYLYDTAMIVADSAKFTFSLKSGVSLIAIQ